jgi:hypothetical protein
MSDYADLESKHGPLIVIEGGGATFVCRYPKEAEADRFQDTIERVALEKKGSLRQAYEALLFAVLLSPDSDVISHIRAKNKPLIHRVAQRYANELGFAAEDELVAKKIG